MIISPKEIDSDVKKLISIVCPGSKPIYLKVQPENYSEINECFPAVQEKIRRDGGFWVLGWQIWKSEVLIEAEFHAVWKSPDGVLIDITPKQLPISDILFLPDQKAKYDGSQVDNIRLNISGNRLVDDFIEIAKAIFKLENEGERAFQYEVGFTGRESQIYQKLNVYKNGIYLMVKEGKSRKSYCFCGSRNKYKHCCGKSLSKILKLLQ